MCTWLTPTSQCLESYIVEVGKMRWEMKKVGGHNQGIIKNERGKKWRRKVGKRNGRGTEVEEGQR